MFQRTDPHSQQHKVGGSESGGWVTKEHMYMASHRKKVSFKCLANPKVSMSTQDSTKQEIAILAPLT